MSFEPYLKENEDGYTWPNHIVSQSYCPNHILPIILSSRQGIQSYVEILINHDMTLPSNIITGSINQAQYITQIEPTNINFEEKRKLLGRQKNEIRQQQPTDNSNINRQLTQNHQVKKVERFINKPMHVDKVNKVLRDLDLSQEEQDHNKNKKW